MNFKKSIKIGILGSLVFIPSFNLFAQSNIIEPGDNNVNAELLHTGSFLWEQITGFSFEDKEKSNERFITVKRIGKDIIIEERLTKKGVDEQKTSTVINAKTLEPIRTTFENDKRTYNYSFGKNLKGRLINKLLKNDYLDIDIPLDMKAFDITTLDYVVSTLPLTTGYRAIIPVIYPNNKKQYLYNHFKIIDIVEKKAHSCLSGYYDVLEVKLESINESHTKKYKTVYLDKKTRRIVRTEDKEIASDMVAYADLEQHINPIKIKFDVVEAKAMIKQGTSIITGQAYTRDNNPAKKSILYGGKKIVAPKGSIVMLTPNTPYLKEWLEFNASVRKANPPEYLAGKLYKGCHGYPLPLEVKEQTLLTEVTDNKGSFSFQNLKPGEYHVLVQFVATKYTNTTRTPNGSYDITINPDGTGSAKQNVDVKHWGSPTDVTNYSLVKVTKDSETVKVKLNN